MVEMSARGHVAPSRRGSSELPDDYLVVTLAYLRAGVVALMARGEIDLCTAPKLQQALGGLLQSRVPGIVVDLSGVDYLGVAGARVLYTSAEQARAALQRVVLVVRTHAVQRALKLTGVTDLIPAYRDFSDAVCALSPAGNDGKKPGDG